VATYGAPAPGRTWSLTGSYGRWLRDLRSLQGAGVGTVQRIDHATGHLPGFGPGAAPAQVRILGPVTEPQNGQPALRFLDGLGKGDLSDPSLTRNGHSIVLRIDYDQVRILLTGDLNFRSQALLLKHIQGTEFHSHVAKACHHGSEDISSTFLKAMSPLATMISSGDNESYAHPRAKVLGLTGAFGELRTRGSPLKYLDLSEERHVAPLIYSTELSRSIRLFAPYAAFTKTDDLVADAKVESRSGPPKERRRDLDAWLLGDRMVYGLINVRTDGKKIVMAVLKESDASFQVEELTV
jgi:hypothetical protein